jgi:hypothetical protein
VNRYHLRGLQTQIQQDEPTAQDLDAIEREWPLIEAEIALLDAEIHVLTADGGPSVLDWRRLRHAEARVTREAAAFLTSADEADGPVAA